MSRRSPSLPGLIAAFVVAGTVACGSNGDRTPTAPTPPTTQTPPPTSEGLVTGTAVEFTPAGEGRPVPNLRLRVRAGSDIDGAVGGAALPDVITDRNGRYEIAGFTGYLLFFSADPGSGFKFLCDEYPVYTQLPSDTGGLARIRDLPVVRASWAIDRLPPRMWWIGTTVYGIVSERVGGVPRPVAGATVTLDGGHQDPPATTNANGFYMACSVVGTDQLRTITARKAGYADTAREIVGARDSNVDLELTRQ